MTSTTTQPRQHYNITFALVALGALTYTLLQAMLVPALPVLQEELHTDQANVSWIFTSFLLSASIATPVLGRLGDMFGKRRMLIIVFCAVVVGSFVAALATNLPVMIAARVVQGLGAAVFPLAFGIIRDEFPSERVPGAIGGISAILGVGSGLGIVLAGPIIDHLSWHWLFWAPFAMALVTLVATIRYIPESPVRVPGRVNIPAAIVLSGWLTALLLGVSQGSHWGWQSPRILGLFAAAVVIFGVWIMVELRSKEPLIDVRMMRQPAVWWTNITALLFGFGMYSMMVVIPAFMEAPRGVGYGFHSTATGVGLVMLPNTLGMLVIGLLIGRVVARVGSKVPIVVGGLVDAACIGFLAVEHGELWMFVASLTFFGFGMGLAFSSMTNVLIDAVPSHQTGVATGMNANIRTIGGAVGSQVVSAIVVSGVAAKELPPESGYTNGLIAMAIALAAAGLVAIIIPGAKRRSADGAAAQLSGTNELALAADATVLAAAVDAGEVFSAHRR
ncbi:MAG: major facilitator superfamily 1 [Thermoleophilia bacterium]|nr:major facilitator superfamily 1 [Thermoleophilia bacterium]